MLNIQALTFAMADAAGPIILVLAVIAVIIIICIANMHVVPQGKAYVVEHLGSYRRPGRRVASSSPSPSSREWPRRSTSWSR